MHTPLDNSTLNQLFTQARTFSAWQDKAVTTEQLHELYELTKLAPTSTNGSPARFVFITSPEAKAKLKPALAEGNVAKTMNAPVTVIVATDYNFYEHLPQLFPQTDAKSWFVGNQALIDDTAFRNSSLQGAYLIMAARALGLDTGAMSGFDNTLRLMRHFLQVQTHARIF
jgi:3-hydroxypropanoate dehydrogenase